MLKRLFASRKKPYFPNDKQEELISVLSGTTLSFTCPLPSVPSAIPYQKHLQDVNIFDHVPYEHFDERNKNLLKHHYGAFPSLQIIRRDWGFYGSIFNEEIIGRVALSASILYADSLPKEMTCFNPEHFEQVVIRQLYYSGGPGNIANEEITSPVKWQITNINSIEWINFEIYSDSDPDRPSIQFYTPIDERHFIRFNYSTSGCLKTKDGLEMMRKITHQLMSRVQIKLNKSSENLFLNSKNIWPNAKYSENRKPEHWVFFDYDEDLKKYLKKGSQPPEWKLSS